MRATLLTLAIALVALAGPAEAQRRLALVIGNDTYRHVAPLTKAVADAHAVGDRLARLGFDVTRVYDATAARTEEGVDRFLDTIATGDTVLLYYAGHGVEIDGRNYLLPVDLADPGTGRSGEAVLREGAVPLSGLLRRLADSPAGVTIAIVDACRDDPLSDADDAGRAGLAAISAPEGSFVLFSAGPGQTALDRVDAGDTDPNSLFTRTLLPMLGRPGLDIRSLSLELRRKVARAAALANHEQVPAYSDNLLFDFVFVEEGEAPRYEVFHESALAEDFAAAQALDTRSGWQRFLRRHASAAPHDPRVAAARAALDSRAAPRHRPAEPALTRLDRAHVQLVLRRYGYEPGGIDGIFGSRTRGAIRAWQRAIGARATGYLTDRQARRLLAEEAAPRAPWRHWPERYRAHPPTVMHPFRDTRSHRYVDRNGCAREADGSLIFCPSAQGGAFR